MKKLFLILAIAGFIACNSLIGGSDDIINSGDYVVRGIYKTKIDNSNYVNFAIENISGSDLYLDSIVIIYGDFDNPEKIVIDDLQHQRFRSGQTRFYSKRIFDNFEEIRYKIYQR